MSLWLRIRHAYRVAWSLLRERAKRRYAPLWEEAAYWFLKEHPRCAACGGKVRLQVHHSKPPGLAPELELDHRNLLALCMGPLECHLRIGHGGRWDTHNPNVQPDAEIVLVNPDLREEYEAKAKALRKRASV
jgi:hypothetical protein